MANSNSNSMSNSGPDFTNAFKVTHEFDLTNVVKKGLTSAARPQAHNSPLESQLAPSIQQRSYKQGPLDRLVDKLGQVLGTNEQSHTASPSSLHSTSKPAHQLKARYVSFKEYDRLSKFYIATGTIWIFLSLCLLTWWICRCVRRRKAEKRRDIESPNVEDERIEAPKETDDHQARVRSQRGLFSMKLNPSTTTPSRPRSLSSLTLDNPFADPAPPNSNTSSAALNLVNDAEQQWRASSPPAPCNAPPPAAHIPQRTASLASTSRPNSFFPATFRQNLTYQTPSIFSRGNNPFSDRATASPPTQAPEQEQGQAIELSEKHDDGLGGTFRRGEPSDFDTPEAKAKRIAALKRRIDAEERRSRTAGWEVTPMQEESKRSNVEYGVRFAKGAMRPVPKPRALYTEEDIASSRGQLDVVADPFVGQRPTETETSIRSWSVGDDVGDLSSLRKERKANIGGKRVAIDDDAVVLSHDSA